MGWQSSMLGSNIISSYEHIDNLRNDLTAGKFWDSGETKFARIRHDGTDALLESSSGNISFCAASGTVTVFDPAKSKSLFLSHTGTNGIVNSNNGMLVLTGGADNRRVQIGADSIAGMLLRMRDQLTGVWKRVFVNNGVLVIETDE